MIKPAPIRERIAENNGIISNIWALWFQKLVGYANAPVTDQDIEITDDAKGLILQSPDGTRWRVQVTDLGVLTTTALP